MLTKFAHDLVRGCRRVPWLVAAAALALTVAAAIGAVTTLTINTDTDALFDRDLPFRVAERAFDKQFPVEVDLIVAVIEGPSTPEAQAAADHLAAALAARSDLFVAVQNPTGGPFFAKNGLLYLSTTELEDLTAKLAAAQPLLGSISTDRNARGIFRLIELAFMGAAQGDAAAGEIAPAADQVSKVISAVLEGKSVPMNWQSLFNGLAPPGPLSRAMVVARPKLDMAALEQGGSATAFIRQAARGIGLTPENGYRVRLTGQVPLSDEEFATIAEGTSVSGVLSVVLVAILLFMALGSGRVVGAALLTLAVGLVLTFGWAAITVGEINLISIAFAVMFIGIAVDFAIQFCMRYRAERRHLRESGTGLGDALDAAGAAMAKPLVLATAATALGFFSFLPTAYRGVSQLGVIAGGGMIIAAMLSFTLLPALLQLFRPPEEKAAVGYLWAGPINRIILHRRTPVLVGAGLLALVSLAALPNLVFDFDPLKLKDPATESMSTALDLMDDPLVNPNTLSALVATGDEAKALAQQIADLPEVDHAQTIFDLIPEDQDAKLAMIEDLGFLMGPALEQVAARPAPTTEDVIASAQNARRSVQAYLETNPPKGRLRTTAMGFITAIDQLLTKSDPKFLTELSRTLLVGFDEALAPLKAALTAEPVTIENLPMELRSTYISQDGRYRVQVFPAGAGSDGGNLTRFLLAVQHVAPKAFGTPVVIYESGRIVTRAFATAASLSVAAITLLLFAVMRRPGDVLRVLTPLVFAALLTLGTCAITGFALNFANIIALPLLFGVGVTFPIYFVTAWREGESALLSSPAGRGMLYSALTTAAAFGSLAISKHTGTAAMGILLTLALGYTLLATLVLLPALLGPAPHAHTPLGSSGTD